MKKYTILIISGCCVLAAGIAGLALLLNQPPVSESSVPEFVMPSQTVSTDSSSAPETPRRPRHRLKLRLEPPNLPP